ADYIALGHIHRPQVGAKREHIRYCGSPIPLSFDELKSKKQVCVVEFVQGERTISQLEVPIFQPLAEIKGDLSEIES
ncbi:exonuclease subunit SbcD, partial [Klebsiella pneumoniae]